MESIDKNLEGQSLEKSYAAILADSWAKKDKVRKERTVRKREEMRSRGITNEAVFNLESHIKNLLGKIAHQIDSGAYRLIIGDDVSGRIPALLMGKTIDHIYKDRGFEKPERYFYSGKSKFRTHSLESTARARLGITSVFPEHNALSKKGIIKQENLSSEEAVGGKMDRVLVVTDTINTGSSVEFLTRILEELGIPYDVVTITEMNQGEWHHSIKNLYSSERSTLAPEIFSGDQRDYKKREIRDMTGIYKNNSLTAKTIKREDRRYYDEMRKLVKNSRHDIDILSRDLAKWFDKVKQRT